VGRPNRGVQSAGAQDAVSLTVPWRNRGAATASDGPQQAPAWGCAAGATGRQPGLTAGSSDLLSRLQGSRVTLPGCLPPPLPPLPPAGTAGSVALAEE